MTARVLVVEHEATCPVGRLGDWLEHAGVRLDVRRPWAGEPLPADLGEHDGLVVLGGSMGAYDDDRAPWLPATRALLGRCVATDVPALAVCLGHQLLAVACGGIVGPSPHGRQIGVLPVDPVPSATDDPLLARLPPAPRALYWNDDVVLEPPTGATVLAAGSDGLVQVLRLGSAVGVQFHPEVDADIVRVWAEHDAEAGSDRGTGERVVAELAAVQGELHETWAALGAAFAGMLRG